MSNVNRDYLIAYDVKTGKVVLSRPIEFYVTDRNTSNIFIKLVTQISIDYEVDEFVELEPAENFEVSLRVIKPNDDVKNVTAQIMRDKSIFQVDLKEEFKDISGTYQCELLVSTTVNGTQELNTSDSFTYQVKRSLLSNVETVIETGDMTVEKLLNDINATKLELTTICDRTKSEVLAKYNETKEELSAKYDEIAQKNENLSLTKVNKGELVVNVKDFGAVGDGVTDDTNAIRSAIGNGDIITFPRGIYRITDTIYINSPFVMNGEGWSGDSSFKNLSSTILFDDNTPGKFAFECSAPNITIKHINFRTKNNNSDRRQRNNCFKFNKGTVYGDTDVEITDCLFQKFCTSVEFEGRGLYFSRNNVVEQWKPIILKHFNNDESVNKPTYDWQTNIRGFRKFHFVDNQIHSCQGWFVSCLSTSDNNYEKHIHQVVVSGNRLDGTGGLWEGFIGGGIVTGNTIGKSDSTVYSNVRIPVFSLLGCKQMTFVGNTIYSELEYSNILNRQTETDDVWAFGQNLGDFQDIVITGNTLRNIGRRVVKASQANVYRLIFTNNNINGVLLIETKPTVSAFEFDGGVNHLKIKDNIIINTNGVKHDKLINFSQRGAKNHDIKDNIFNGDEFTVSNNAYSWNHNSNIIHTAYTGNGSGSQSFTVNQNIDYIIITDPVNKKSFIKRSGTAVGDNVCEISDNKYTIKNTTDFNNNGTTYAVIVVCC